MISVNKFNWDFNMFHIIFWRSFINIQYITLKSKKEITILYFTFKINLSLHCDNFNTHGIRIDNDWQKLTLFSGHMPDVWAFRRLNVAPRWILGQFRSTDSKACVAQLLGTIYKIKQMSCTFWHFEKIKF